MSKFRKKEVVEFVKFDRGDVIVKDEQYTWSIPKEIFDEEWEPVQDEKLPEQFNFPQAFLLLKDGFRVKRSGWVNSYVTLQKAYPAGININKNTAEATGLPEGTLAKFRPYLLIKLPDNSFAYYAPNNVELFAEDWELAE